MGAFKRFTDGGSHGTTLPSISLGEVGNASALPLESNTTMSSVSQLLGAFHHLKAEGCLAATAASQEKKSRVFDANAERLQSVIAGPVESAADPGHDYAVGDSVHGIGIEAIDGSLIAFQVIDDKDLSIMVDIAVRPYFINDAACRFE